MLHLLDTPHLVLHGARAELPVTKPALLLCYLALQGDWVSRGALAALVSPQMDEDNARHRVRVLLNRAKDFAWAKTLEVENARVRFQIAVDVQDFRAAVGRGDWAAALERYRKPLLMDFPVEGEGLTEWLSLERERLEATWLEAVRARAAELTALGDHRASGAVWNLVLERDALNEEALRGVLRASYLIGQRAVALETFARFRTTLRLEVQLEPMPETLELVRLIEAAQPLEFDASRPSVPLSILQPPRFVGRSAEAARAKRSASRVVVVSGEPGVGKTRFLRDLEPSARMLRGVDGLEGVSYAPLLSFARSVDTSRLEALGAYRADLARLLPELDPNASSDALDALGTGARLLEAFARLLESSSEPLVVDDLQWVDAATLECLTYTLSREHVKLYCTLRRDEVTPALTKTLRAWRAEVIHLEPLDASDTARLVSSLIGVDASFPVFSQWLHERSGGNVFFALEVLKNLFETGRLRAEDGEWHSVLDAVSRDYAEFDVPATVNDLVLRRVSRLSETAQRVARAASVLGEGFDLDALAVTADLPRAETLDALETLETAGVLREHGFQHDLLRQSILRSLSDTRRRQIHARAGTLSALSGSRRADHLLLAGRPLEALPLLLSSGADLKRRGLLTDARHVLERVLEIDADNLEALAQLANVAQLLGDSSRARDFSTRVLQRPNADALTRARALNVQATLLYNDGRIAEAAPIIEEAIAITAHLERQDADFEETAFDIFETQGRYDDAIALLEPAIQRLSKHGDSGALAMCLSSLAGIYDDTGRYADALQLHFQALETAKRAGARYAHVNAAIHMMWGLRHANRSLEAVRICREALSLGEYSNTEYLRNALGAVLMHLGELEEALEVYEHNARHGNVTTKTLAWGRMASLYHDLGQLEAARHAATLALENAARTEVQFARMRAAIAVLRFGTDEQVARALRLVEGQRNPDIDSQAEFEIALAARQKSATTGAAL